MNWVRIGFTGPRDGMTAPQMQALHDYLARVQLVSDHDPGITGFEFHHGDCAGSDAQAHVIATVLRWRTVAHPPDSTVLRAWCQADEIRDPKPYLARDWDIAAETGELLAAPKNRHPYPGSGTWATIGYGVQLGRPVKAFMRDGTLASGRELLGQGVS